MDTSLIIKRGLLRGIRTLKYEGGLLTALGALVGTLTLVQLLMLGGITIFGMQNILESQTDLRLEIVPTAPDQSIQDFYSAAQSLPYVEGVQIITKEQAYEEERGRDPELTRFLEEFHLENPFPDVIAVRLHSLSDYDAFAAFSREDQWSSVVNPAFLSEVTNQEEEVREMLKLTQAGTKLTILFLACTAGVLLFIIIEMVRRRALQRSEEVLVERLVGAGSLSVLLPFATEAAILLLVATVVSTGFLLVFLYVLPLFLPALGPGGFLALVSMEIVSLLQLLGPQLLLAEIIGLPLLAALGAWLGMRRQLGSSRLILGM